MKCHRLLLVVAGSLSLLAACKEPSTPPPTESSAGTPVEAPIEAAVEAPVELPLDSPGRTEVLPGVEVLARDFAGALAGQRVAILTNPTGVTRDLQSTIDVVRALPGVIMVRLFAPEHGLRGQFFAGDKVDNQVDPISGLPVVSLYGGTRKPTPEMLEGLDVVIYDIQDVGHRTYTFVSSLTYLMEACEAAGVAVWVLDRPDPTGGDKVGGPVIDEDLLSFIGIHPVPQVYGLTPGEWAQMIRAERTPGIDLRVITMDGWRRGMTFGELGWIWVPTSQHIPHWESSFFYAMTGTLGEKGGINIGVGTPTPFQLIGAPWMDGQALGDRLNARGLPGVIFRPTSYTPRYAAFTGKLVHGVQIHISDYATVEPAAVTLAVLSELAAAYPERKLFKNFTNDNGSATGYLKALGSRTLAQKLADNQPAEADPGQLERLQDFRARREAYLLYD